MAKKADPKQKTLAAAERLFAVRGFDGVSMRDIASKSGLSVSNLYYYFPSKEALIVATLEHCFSRGMDTFQDQVLQTGAPKERFESMVRWGVRLLFSDPIFARLFIRENIEQNEPRARHLVEKVFNKTLRDYEDIIASYARHGDPTINTAFMVSVIWGFFQMAPSFHAAYHQGPFKPDPDALADTLIFYLSHAFGAGDEHTQGMS